MKTIRELFYTLDPNTDGASVKYDSYLDVYDQIFTPLRDKEIKLLEIGIEKGGSLSIWSKAFPKGKIVGLDIVPGCKKNERDNIKVHIGDQTDRAFLTSVGKEDGPFDIIIDDGGHYTNQHNICLETLYEYLKIDGLYIIEDLHTCYMEQFHKNQPTIMDTCKDLIDRTSNGPSIFKSMHFYRNIVVMEKGYTEPKKVTSQGFEQVPYPS